MITRVVSVTLPPEARIACPPLTPPPTVRLPEDKVFVNWSSDRIARNVCEARRAAAVLAVDAASGVEPK